MTYRSAPVTKAAQMHYRNICVSIIYLQIKALKSNRIVIAGASSGGLACDTQSEETKNVLDSSLSVMYMFLLMKLQSIFRLQFSV